MIFTTNLYESVVFAQACARLGCVHYMLNATFTVSEVISQLESFNPHLIFTMSHVPHAEENNNKEVKWTPTKDVLSQAFAKIKSDSDFRPNSAKIVYTIASRNLSTSEVPSHWTDFSQLV